MNKKMDPARAHAICAVLDGRDSRLLQWITDSQISALIAAVRRQAVPARPDGQRRASIATDHELPVQARTKIGEIWWLKDLALWLQTKRSRCAAALPLPCVVGSPATPVATV